MAKVGKKGGYLTSLWMFREFIDPMLLTRSPSSRVTLLTINAAKCTIALFFHPFIFNQVKKIRVKYALKPLGYPIIEKEDGSKYDHDVAYSILVDILNKDLGVERFEKIAKDVRVLLDKVHFDHSLWLISVISWISYDVLPVPWDTEEIGFISAKGMTDLFNAAVDLVHENKNPKRKRDNKEHMYPMLLFKKNVNKETLISYINEHFDNWIPQLEKLPPVFLRNVSIERFAIGAYAYSRIDLEKATNEQVLDELEEVAKMYLSTIDKSAKPDEKMSAFVKFIYSVDKVELIKLKSEAKKYLSSIYPLKSE